MYVDEEAYVFKLIRELSFTYQANDPFELEMGVFPAVFGAERSGFKRSILSRLGYILWKKEATSDKILF
jgi:hypothetical protein